MPLSFSCLVSCVRADFRYCHYPFNMLELKSLSTLLFLYHDIPDFAEVKVKQESEWEPKLLGFLCRWCSYAGADLAGTSRKKYPANIRIIKVPCSGRVDPLFILKALRLGFDGVLVSGCYSGDCHYQSENYFPLVSYMVY